MKIRFSQQISGERKAVMEIIAGATGTQACYTRAPRFAYEAGGWSIDREGVLTSPVFPIREAVSHANIIGTLGERSINPEGSLSVAIFPNPFDPALLGNIAGILSGKATLLRHALGIADEPSVALADGGFTLPFFPAAVNSPAVLAALQFSALTVSQAAAQKQVRTRDRPVANEKYAMRCFLLRIGMIGPEYASARRELLSRLSGDGSFKSGARPGGDGGDCLSCAGSMSEPGAEADRLFCVERREYVPEDGSCPAFNR